MRKLILGNFITVEENVPNAEAVIVDNGLIEFVGNKKDAYDLLKGEYETLDYSDKYIYPGFIEPHCHGFLAGYRSIGQADLTKELEPYENYIPIIKKYIKDNPNNIIYLAAGWNETERKIDHTFLDNICSDKPLLMNTTGGHSFLLNSAALNFFEIDEKVAREYGEKQVHVYPDGKPTGYICENAAIRLLSILKINFDEAKDYLLKWQDTALSKGYTTVCDAGAELFYKDLNSVYESLEKEGKLKLKTYAYSIVNDNVENPKEAIEKIKKLKEKYDSKHYAILGAKVFLDGVAESRTSWTLNEYSDEKDYYGLKRFSDENKMVELITEASKIHLAVHAHSEGDGATNFFLNCIEKSQNITHDLNQRNVLAHLHFVLKDDFSKMAKTNSIPLVAPLWTPKFPGGFETEVRSFGLERATNGYPIKSFFDEGCKVCYHTDYPISPILDIARSFYMAETRTIPEEKEFGHGDLSRKPSEAVRRMDSLKALTINPAYALKQENIIGSIKEGKIANFVVMDGNLLKCKIEDVAMIQILYTIVEGEVVFSNI